MMRSMIICIVIPALSLSVLGCDQGNRLPVSAYMNEQKQGVLPAVLDQPLPDKILADSPPAAGTPPSLVSGTPMEVSPASVVAYPPPASSGNGQP